VRRFNATLSAKGYVWFWPKIAAALTSKHHWLVINCDSCGTVVDLDLRVKQRDPEASIRVALRDVQCPAAMAMDVSAHCVVAASVDLRGVGKFGQQRGTMKSAVIKRAIMIDGHKTSISRRCRSGAT
jgi:hypothetical protein